jgi:antitoxin FitA
MAQLVVRNLENSVKARLQRRAKRNGRSMEEEVRDILRNAANDADHSTVGLGTQIAALLKGTGLKFKVRELRGQLVKPASFDE